MSYVDALHDRAKDRIHVVERVDGQRVYREYPANYTFYYDDAKGKFRTMYGTPVSRFSTRSYKEFQKELRLQSDKRTWESDIKPVFRCLEEHYMGVDSPKLHTAFFDIEVDFDPVLGYSKPEDPFNKITAITIYLDWLEKLVTLCVAPKSMSQETAEEICAKFSDCFLFQDEVDMLDTFLNLIEDADVLSGWNSEGYDIPYTVNRVRKIMSKDDTRRFCLLDQYPKVKEFEKFGKKSSSYELIGRVHLDYMDLYRKYTYEERHSYSLDAIGEYELNERKVDYDGTLDQLYNQDFETFIEYNRQDVMLLSKLDKKLKFLELANELAHENTVLLVTTMGAVAVTDQAIINEAHQRGMVVPDKKRYAEKDADDEEEVDTSAAGAYVAYPKKGMHDYVGAIDINSLYPSAIRALNMGPETIVGQLRPIMTEQYIANRMQDRFVNGKKYKGLSKTAAWEGLFGSLEYNAVMNMEKGTEITIDWEESGETTSHSAEDVWRLIFDSNQPWCISANGTIFRYDTKGVIPGLLARWYAERKELQAKKKAAKEAGDKAQEAFWDKRQLVKKINLNSLYGAILNKGCRFYDSRIGQSTTLTGRTIAKHMHSHINECFTGKYDHEGDAIVYGDTDSSYFSAWPIFKQDVIDGKMKWNKDVCVEIYDAIADSVNESFPAFMERACHCPREMGGLIKGGRELIAEKGLFITKKRYAVLIYDLEGDRLDLLDEATAKKKGVVPGVGKVKALGLDLKRSDTPKHVQDFLSEILLDTLTGKGRDYIVKKIIDYKTDFANKKPWEKGTPKRVNNLTKFTNLELKLGRANMPGHVRAAMNWNNLKRLNADNYSMNIVDGMKTVVCKLKNNPLGYENVGVPTDQTQLPDWFKNLPFDDDLMEATIVDQKVENLLGVLSWDLGALTDTKTTFQSLFSFE